MNSVLENLASLFLDTPPVSDLRDMHCRISSQHILWQCQNAHEWRFQSRSMPGKQGGHPEAMNWTEYFC